MRRWTRWMLYAAAIVVVAIVSAVITLVWVDRPRPSALTDGIAGGSWARSSADFDARVRRRFPMGTPQQDVVTILSREGFEAEWPWTSGEHGAVRREDSLVCNVAARVYWRVDAAQQLTSVRGVYREEGCL